MSQTTFIALWLLSGLCGCLLIWSSDKINDGNAEWCPTPRAILFALIGCFGGGGVLLIGLGVFIAIITDHARHWDNWFTRPICGRKDEQ